MFAGKAEARLERFARDRHSSLLGTLVNYSLIKFYKIGPWGLNHQSCYGQNLFRSEVS